MELNEIQVIWDTQNKQRLYAVDEAGLHAIVQKQGLNIKRCLIIFEIVMMLVTFGMAVAVLVEPVFYGHDYHQIFGAVMLFIASVYLSVGVIRRRRAETAFDQSLRGDLDRAVFQLDYRIGRLRSSLWWFILPVALGSLVSLILLYDSKPVWIWPLVFGSLALGYWLMHREIHTQLLPKKRDFESLRDKLVG